MLSGHEILKSTAEVFSKYPEWKRKEKAATASELRNADFALVQEGVCTEQELVSVYARICSCNVPDEN